MGTPGQYGARGFTPGIPYRWGTVHDGLTASFIRSSGVSNGESDRHLFAWIRPTNFTGYNPILDLSDGVPNDRFYLFINQTTGTLIGRVRRSGANVVIVNSSAPLVAGALSFVAVSWASGAGNPSRLWINGVDVTTHAAASVYTAPVVDEVTIGANAGGTVFLGKIYRTMLGAGPCTQADVDFVMGLHDWRLRRSEHLWLHGDGPRDTADFIGDEGVVGGWDAVKAGAPSLVYEVVPGV